MTDRTIGETAELLGVTTRTLRHWDNIGLLQPGWRTTTDYRLYTDDDVERATQILVYKSAGVPLKEIVALLARPESAAEHLKRQRALLIDRIGHLHRMVRAVDEILEEDTMSIEDRIETLGKDWHEEAEERWGNTSEWEQSQNVLKNMTEADVQAAKDEHNAFIKELIDASLAGIAPGSPEGNQLALRHRASIGKWYAVSASKQVCLARMYVSDERFNETYQGHAAFLLSLVEAQAEAEGVDLNNVEWV